MGNLGGVATNSMNAVPAPTLLIADDDPQLRTALAEVFAGQGYLVRTAATGEESLELIDRDPVDCLLIDFNLPGLTGLETIQLVHQQPIYPVSILITAQPTPKVLQSALLLKVYTVLSKPIARAVVTTTVQRALKHRPKAS
jgi:CheY-like chemotaxis protein